MSIPDNIIQYKSVFNFCDTSSNPLTFFLEGLSFSKVESWRKSFSYDKEKDKIICNHKYLSKLIIELNNILKGNLNIYGHSFSKNDLVLGNLYLYYIQFVSNYLFGHPEAYEPFRYDDIIKNSIKEGFESICDNFYNEEYLLKFLKKNFLQDEKLVFKDLDVLEFQVNINNIPISFGKIKLTIPKTYWIIKILIRN